MNTPIPIHTTTKETVIRYENEEGYLSIDRTLDKSWEDWFTDDEKYILTDFEFILEDGASMTLKGVLINYTDPEEIKLRIHSNMFKSKIKSLLATVLDNVTNNLCEIQYNFIPACKIPNEGDLVETYIKLFTRFRF